MKTSVYVVFAAAIMCASTSGTSQETHATSANTSTVAATVRTWVDNWNAHDAKAIGQMLTPDVDFVLVNGRWLKGRDEFVQVHTDQFKGRYSTSEFAVDGEPNVTLLKPDLALIQWHWIITHVRNPNGTPAPTYKGIFTWVLVEGGAGWTIRAAQNTITQ